MLVTQGIPALQQLNNFHELIFVQDGAPAHRAGPTIELWNETFGLNRVWSISCHPEIQFETEWSPFSPDMTPFDFWAFSCSKCK